MGNTTKFSLIAIICCVIAFSLGYCLGRQNERHAAVDHGAAKYINTDQYGNTTFAYNGTSVTSTSGKEIASR